MKIIGGRVTSVEARKLEGTTFTGFDFNIQIKDVKEVGKTLEIEYEHITKYGTNFAEMVIKGVVIAEGDRKDVEEFKKNKQFPVDKTGDLLMAINYATGTVGTLLAFAIGVNAPINVPRPKLQAMPGQPASKAG